MKKIFILVIVFLIALLWKSYGEDNKQNNEINTIAQFLLDRANDNMLFMMQNKMIDNSLFKLYFPHTCELIMNYKLNAIGLNFSVWSNSIVYDIDNLRPFYYSPNDFDILLYMIKNLNIINTNNKFITNALNYFSSNSNYISNIDGNTRIISIIDSFTNITNLLKSIKTNTITDLIEKNSINDLTNTIDSTIDLLKFYRNDMSNSFNIDVLWGTNMIKGYDNLINIRDRKNYYEILSYFTSFSNKLCETLEEIKFIKDTKETSSYTCKIMFFLSLFNKFYSNITNKIEPLSIYYIGQVVNPFNIIYHPVKATFDIIETNFETNHEGLDLYDYTSYISELVYLKPVSKYLDNINNTINNKFIEGYTYENYNNFKTYASFFSLIADNNSSQLTNLLKTFTLPSVSYELKRKNKMHFSISSYLGVDFEDNFSYDYNNLSNYNIKISTPVGFELSQGFGNSSYSIFFGILDFGKAVNGIIYNNTTNLTWLSIISPCFSFVWGIGNFPLAISLNYLPYNPINNSFNFSMSLFFGFDMPLFPIF